MQFLRFRSAASHKFVTATVFLSFFLPAGDSISQTPQRTLSLDTRYFIHGYSNNAVGRFGIEMIQLGSLPASLIFTSDSAIDVSENAFLFYDSQQLRNVGEGLTLLLGSTFFAGFFQLPFHEYGHGTRFAAVGLKPFYAYGSPTNTTDQKTYGNFFSYYVASILYFGGGYTSSREDLFSPLSNELYNGWNAVVSMGGVNNSMFFTEMIEDDLYHRGGHVGFTAGFVFGKLSAALYGTGGGLSNDISSITGYYRTRGFNIDREKIKTSGKTSLLLSAMTYQFAYQFIRLLMGESTRFRPWEFYGVQLPNTAFYMTRDGLSYKVRSGYRYESWRFLIAVEHVFEGKRRTEISFGAENQFGDLSATLQTIIGKGREVEVELGYRFNEWILVSGGYALYDVNNLHGERLIPSLEHGSTYHDAYLRASLVY